MKIFKQQILAGTKVDLQGEKIPKRILEGFVKSSNGRKIPLNQSHDFAKQCPGYMENLNLIEDENEKDEWALVGDIYCEPEKLEEVMGGFSISYLEITHPCKDDPEILLYLPYPYYNDHEYLERSGVRSQHLTNYGSKDRAFKGKLKNRQKLRPDPVSVLITTNDDVN